MWHSRRVNKERELTWPMISRMSPVASGISRMKPQDSCASHSATTRPVGVADEGHHRIICEYMWIHGAGSEAQSATRYMCAE